MTPLRSTPSDGAELLAERLSESEADEDRLEVAQAYLHLAKLHHVHQDLKATSAVLERGLALSDAYNVLNQLKDWIDDGAPD